MEYIIKYRCVCGKLVDYIMGSTGQHVAVVGIQIWVFK